MGKSLATAELILAASLWGFGFVAAVWGMRALGPFELTFLRFALAAALLPPLLLANRKARQELRGYARTAFLPALFFAGTLLVQTWGLRYTTATKSGFITTLYVVFVPLLESFLRRRRLPRALWLCVAVSLLGTLLIVNVGLESINKGDLLTLLCAVLAAGQIYVIGIVSPGVKRPFLFNSVQAAWAALLCVPFVLRADFWDRLAGFASWPAEAKIGVLALAFGSTVIAFSLQVRAQAHLSPTVSSLLFLLESPFAMIFSILLLGEFLGPLEAAGAALIFLSALSASLLESRRKKY